MKRYLLMLCLGFTCSSYAVSTNLNAYDLKHLQLLGTLKKAKDAVMELHGKIGDQELTPEQKIQVSALVCEQYRSEVEFLKYTMDHEKDIQWDRDESGYREMNIEKVKDEYIKMNADYMRMQNSFKDTPYACKQ